MIVDCAHYRDGRRQHEGRMDPREAAAICRRDPGFVWLGMVDPAPEELATIQHVFGLHELAVEDAQSFHLRPKVERYEDGITFVVLRTARYVDESEEVEFGEISIFIGPGFVITVRQGIASDLHAARLRLEQRPKLLEIGPAAVLWAILDTVVDGYAPVVEGLERDIEDLERTVFSGAAAPTRRIYELRREATDFYRAVHPLLGPAAAIVQGGVMDVAVELREYFRDVDDHLRLVNDEIAAQRDLLSTILQANMAVISVEQNDVVRRISAWAAIITVPTFIASFYGMNFVHMPELRWHAAYPIVVGLMLATAGGLFASFKRAGWL
ncbi:MAG TPA: magnesium/cobalt transporter CorA [Solirubrobacteraceae bacterium]|jgi:magnesium transporter|nr:magnesium/cobalt transporter CorA [Solirubrobacteraceae bacterium]